MITLAIETAIRGGCLSLIKDEQEIGFWIGNKNVSKAEDVLEQISKILDNNRIKVIDLIAVSTGPGSSTGIRIGLATALGLRKSFNCKIVKVPVFDALTLNKLFNKPTVLAIPVGKRQVAWQTFYKDKSVQKHHLTEVKIENISIFLELLNNQNISKVILHSELTKIVLNRDEKIEASRIETMDDRLAMLIGLQGKQVLDDSPRPASDNEKNPILS